MRPRAEVNQILASLPDIPLIEWITPIRSFMLRLSQEAQKNHKMFHARCFRLGKLNKLSPELMKFTPSGRKRNPKYLVPSYFQKKRGPRKLTEEHKAKLRAGNQKYMDSIAAMKSELLIAKTSPFDEIKNTFADTV